MQKRFIVFRRVRRKIAEENCESCGAFFVCLVLSLLFPAYIFAACGTDTVQDADGNTYGTVQIGEQCWMSENLNVGIYVASVHTTGHSDVSNNGIVEKYCYGNNENNCDTYGGLYDWNEAMGYVTTSGAQGICPDGWHIPTDAEQHTLEGYLKDEGQTCDPSRGEIWDCATAGTKLKSGGSSGFEGLLAGVRGSTGAFYDLGTFARFWSSSFFSESTSWHRLLSLSEARVKRVYAYGHANGFSVRCLKDPPDTTAPTLSETTPIRTPANESTPSYTFTSDEAGTITYGGSCSSSTDEARAGENTITFIELSDGTYSDCTITITDSSSNESDPLSVSAFTIDTTTPTLTETTAVSTPTNDTTPSYTFSTTEAGTVSYSGGCQSASTEATVGENTITFIELSQGTYASCQITVTDSAGNVSDSLLVSSFTIETVAPTLSNSSPSGKLDSDTTSTTLSLTTDENATCRYATENTTYDNMTAFSITGETSHSTVVSSLTPGTYTYYAICRDNVGNDTSHTLSFEVAAREEQASVSDASIKTEGEIQKLDEDGKLHFDKKETKLKGKDESLSGGTVKIYKEGKKIATVDIDSNGNWLKKLDFGHNKTYTIKLKFYDQYGTLKDTKQYDIEVDTEDPVFLNPLPSFQNISRDQKITFTAQDEDGIDYYKIKLLNDRGKIHKPWRKQNLDWYIFPESVTDGTYILVVRAYDKAGNDSVQKTTITVEKLQTNQLLASASLDLQSNFAPTGSNPNTCSYTVKQGDTLWEIAQEAYGSGADYQKITNFNPNLNSKSLQIGQELNLCENDNQQKTEISNSFDTDTQVQGVSDEKENSQDFPETKKESIWWKPWTWF